MNYGKAQPFRNVLRQSRNLSGDNLAHAADWF
jgi:hypothetical protein